jgi:hypothetical protein
LKRDDGRAKVIALTLRRVMALLISVGFEAARECRYLALELRDGRRDRAALPGEEAVPRHERLDARLVDNPRKPPASGSLDALELPAVEHGTNGGRCRIELLRDFGGSKPIRHLWKDTSRSFFSMLDSYGRSERMSFPRGAERAIGPLLEGLVEAQRRSERALQYPELRGLAAALARHSRQLGSPVVWPVGDAAERLAGAAVLLSEGDMRVRGWTDVLSDERVLLVTVAAVSPIELTSAAQHAREMGAAEVHACGVEVADVPACGPDGAFASYAVLAAASVRQPESVAA